MKLYLVRHGDANTPDQSLSHTGQAETQSVAHLLAGCEIDEIIHSTKARTQQTAEILGQIIAPDVTLIQREGIKPNDTIKSLLEEIYLYDRNVMIVGHLPFLESLLMALLKIEHASPVTICNSCVVCLEGDGSNWTISWVVSPQLAGERQC